MVKGYGLEEGLSREDRKKIRDDQARSEGAQLANELRDGEGKMFLSHVEEALVTRLRTLIAEDPECQALANLMAGINRKLSVADRLAKEMMGKAHQLTE
jgi:hypothetical protein